MTSKRSASLRLLALAVSISLACVCTVGADDSVAPTQPVAPAQDGSPPAVSQIDQLRTTLESANTHVEAVSARLDADRQQAREIRERLSRGDEALPEIQAKIDSAAARLSARQREMGLEDMHYAPLKFADDQARLDAIGEFEKSPEYHAALQTISDLAAKLVAVQAESLRRFSASDEYKQALAAAQTADARAALEALKEKRLTADPNVAIAQSRLSAAKAALDAVREQFMQQRLGQIPKVAEVDQKLNAEQARYDVMAAVAATAEHDLADARAMLDRQHAGLAVDRAALDQLTSQISQLQTDLVAAQTRVAQASDDLNRATALAEADQQNRDSALAAAQQQNSQQLLLPSTSYQFAPPPVVYGGPSFYAPAPYYGGFGNIFIVPSRGFGNGWSGNRGLQSRPDFHGGRPSQGAHGGGHR